MLSDFLVCNGRVGLVPPCSQQPQEAGAGLTTPCSDQPLLTSPTDLNNLLNPHVLHPQDEGSVAPSIRALEGTPREGCWCFCRGGSQRRPTRPVAGPGGPLPLHWPHASLLDLSCTPQSFVISPATPHESPAFWLKNARAPMVTRPGRKGRGITGVPDGLCCMESATSAVGTRWSRACPCPHRMECTSDI